MVDVLKEYWPSYEWNEKLILFLLVVQSSNIYALERQVTFKRRSVEALLHWIFLQSTGRRLSVLWLGCGIDGQGLWFDTGRGNTFFFTSERLHHVWGDSASYEVGTVGPFQGVNRPGVKLTTYQHTVPELVISYSPVRNKLCWCEGKNFTIYRVFHDFRA